jgi:putative transposase
MRIVDPETGQTYVEKRRRRYNEFGQPRELTFSCYHQCAFLSRPRTCEWFREALEAARDKYHFQVWAYVVMPEHVHLLVYPGTHLPSEGAIELATSNSPNPGDMSRFLQAVKEPVARKAIAFLKAESSAWLERLRVREGKRIRHRFWQPGGGYDRNITSLAAVRAMIDYIHANPVRRGLVTRPEDWEWSSARWYAGMRPVKIEMDRMVLDELAHTD